MDKTLVVMAAGIGSRFGGLKQIEAVGPNGEFIIDYSIYDALRAGFKKVVFVIRKEIEDIFRKTIGKRLENKIEVVYAFQEISDIPQDKKYLVNERKKPWGTVQAVKVAKEYVSGDFVVINADDFYGLDSFIKAKEFLDSNTNEDNYASINYPFIVTSSKYGSVKRAICEVKDGLICHMIECKVTLKGDYALAEPLNGEASFQIAKDSSVAVNMFAFKNKFFKYLEEYFNNYFKKSDEEILKGEILLPDVIKEYLEKGKITLKNVVSNSDWLGITYFEDLEEVKARIKEKIDNGEYPERLW